MRTNFTLLFLLLLINSIYSQGFKGDTWADALKNKSANVVLTNAHLPKFSEAKDGKGSGLCFDIMNDFASYVFRQYGVRITYQYRPVANTSNFESFLSAVRNSNGGVFGLGDITITDERKSTYDFTPSYFSNMAILITKKGVPELTSLSKIPVTFKGMRAVSQGGTTHDVRLKEMQKKYGFDIINAASSVDKTYRVITSSKYFTYIDLPNYLELSSKGEEVRRHPAGDIPGESYGFIMPKGSDWAPIITEFFNANGGYVKSAKYKKVLSDNLGPEVVKLMGSIAK
ncbi:MAG: transporter substrate-binding domain-containing protein [Bacteroidota bacterium]